MQIRSMQKKIWKDFKIKNLSDYHDLYVQSNALLLLDVSENFWKECIKTYELDPAHFLSDSWLAWHACLNKTGIELELLTDIDMLLNGRKKELEEEYVMQYIDMQNQIINIWKKI